MKVAIITGGSRGLGKSAALKLAEAGTDVILTYRSQKEEADKVVAQIEKLGRKAAALQLDVGNSKSFSDFAGNVKQVLKTKWNREDYDYLVNNAGVGLNATIMETTEEQFDNLVNIHFKGTFFLSQKLLPLMKDGGRILNISTGLTRFAFHGYSAYASMKGALEILTKYMAVELGPRRITANILAPGATETDFGGGHVRDNKDLNKVLAEKTALGRTGQPDDIGGMVVAMLSDHSGWMNAQRVEASGGLYL